MLRVINAEWLKLRRPSLLLGTLGATSGISALVTILTYLTLDGQSSGAQSGPSQTVSKTVLASASGSFYSFTSIAGLIGVISLCVFAAQTSQEYTYGTLRNLLVREPGRLTLLLGKFVAMTLFALAIVSVSAVISIGFSTIFAGGADVSTSLWFTSSGISGLAHALLNVSISVLLYGIAGMVLGLLLRSPISAISIGVLWSLIIENLIGAVKASALNWMPANMLSTIAKGGSDSVSYSHALSLGLAYILLGSLVSMYLFRSRDVSN